MKTSSARYWSPYLVGALIGVLSWFAFLTADRAIGVSTAVSRTSGMIEKAVAPDHVAANSYFKKFRPAIDWEWMLMLGLGVGAFVSSRLAGDKPTSALPALWEKSFGPSRPKRYALAFVGGVILMFGARLAGGCTSGHGISGCLQLALSGWVFFATLFASGLATAALLYGKENGRG